MVNHNTSFLLQTCMQLYFRIYFLCTGKWMININNNINNQPNNLGFTQSFCFIEVHVCENPLVRYQATIVSNGSLIYLENYKILILLFYNFYLRYTLSSAFSVQHISTLGISTDIDAWRTTYSFY